MMNLKFGSRVGDDFFDFGVDLIDEGWGSLEFDLNPVEMWSKLETR